VAEILRKLPSYLEQQEANLTAGLKRRKPDRKYFEGKILDIGSAQQAGKHSRRFKVALRRQLRRARVFLHDAGLTLNPPRIASRLVGRANIEDFALKYFPVWFTSLESGSQICLLLLKVAGKFAQYFRHRLEVISR